MDVNFTGLRNIYGLKVNEMTKSVQGDPLNHTERLYLNVHLKDDCNGKDLIEYKQAIATTDLRDKRNPIYSEFLNISTSKNSVMSPSYNYDVYKFYVNGSPLNVNRQNMKFFTYLAKLLKKIQKLPEEKLVVDNDFKNGPEVETSLIIGNHPQTDIDYSKYIDKMFTYSNVTLRAEDIMANLQDCMEKYLNIK